MAKKRSAVKRKTSFRKNFINTVPYKFEREFDFLYFDREGYDVINRFLSIDCSNRAYGKSVVERTLSEVAVIARTLEVEEGMTFQIPFEIIDAIKEQMPEKYYEIKLKNNKSGLIEDIGVTQPEFESGNAPLKSYLFEQTRRFVGAILVVDYPDGTCNKEMYFFIGDGSEEDDRHIDMNKEALYDICDDMRRIAYQVGGRATLTNMTDVTTNLYTLSTALADYKERTIRRNEKDANRAGRAAASGSASGIADIMRSILDDESGYEDRNELDTDNSIV